MNGNASRNGSRIGSVWVSLFGSVLVPILTTSVAAVLWGVGLRDQALSAVERAKGEEAVERRADLSHYLTREEFLEFRRTDTALRDAQFWSLKVSLDRLTDQVARRR